MQTGSTSYHIIRGTVVLIVFLAFVGWFLFRWLKRSRDDPGVLIIKWLVTVPVLALAFLSVNIFGGAGPFVIVFCAVILSCLWTPNIGAWLVKPLTNVIDGGNETPEPHPFYSNAQAQRKRGHYTEAVAEIRKQLDKFPTDFEGQMLLAEIQGEDLNDLPGAEITIHRFCSQPDHAPQNIVYALNTLADWHLKLAQDREAARQDLQKIIDMFPETELASVAAQRIAHLADTDKLLDAHDRKKYTVARGVEYMGLLQGQEGLKPAEIDPDQLALQYVKQLEQHPLDTEAREKLALLYAESYKRLDLATDQLEQLIQQSNQPVKQMVHWLNLLADLHIQHASDPDAARAVLNRIIDQYPDTAAAENARRRLDYLKLGLKAKETSQPVKLGSYEQDIGLKRKPSGPT